MNRRDLLAACGGLVGAVTAGCLADGPGLSPVEESPAADETPTDTPEGTGDSGTPRSPTPSTTPSGTPPDHYAAADQPNPDHEVRLANDDDRTHTIVVAVTGPEGGTVHESSHTLTPGAEVVPYNLKRAAPEGIQAFEVVAEMAGDREAVTLRTNACYGDALVYATQDGSLYVTYSIC